LRFGGRRDLVSFGDKCVIHKLFLLKLVDRIRTGCRRGRGCTAHVPERHLLPLDLTQPRLDEEPAAHVLRLFLGPVELSRIRIPGDNVFKGLLRERVELLQPNDRNPFVASVQTGRLQIVKYLPAAKHNALDLRGINDGRIIDNGPKTAARQFVQGRGCRGQTQQALRRHDDQRPYDLLPYLTPQHMEVLCRGCRVANLKVVLGTKLEEAFKASRRVFRALPLKAVWKQHYEPAALLPFILRCCDVLIDDHLRAIGEVTELSLPADQVRPRFDRIAVFEAEYPGFRQAAAVHVEAGIANVRASELRERRPAFACKRVVHGRVPLRERTASRILTADANRRTFDHERTEGHRFRKAPVHRDLAFAHLGSTCELPDHLWIDVERFRYQRYLVGNRLQYLRGRTGLNYRGAIVFGRRWSERRFRRLSCRDLFRTIEDAFALAMNRVGHRIQVFLGDDTLTDQVLCIKMAGSRMVFHASVHHGLSVARLITLVVAQPPEADK